MWRHLGLLCALLGAVSADNNGWHMKKVTAIQARVQGDGPVFNQDTQSWLSKYGATKELAYMNNLDTVNLASVEGALMYVQAEGINVNEQSVKCHRKNDMQYVVFYEVNIVQPTNGIKYYENRTPVEYGNFVAMDGAKCTNAGSDLPKDCKVYYGLDGETDVGPMVGANAQSSDPRAPYPNNFWYSYPNSCAQKYRAEKTDQCRAEYPGGLCPLGVEPDGDKCSFSYKILGFINIDDLVGITQQGFSNYQAFCQAGGVEFKAKNTGHGFEVEQCLDFWKDPGNPQANADRTAKMVAKYNEMVNNGTYANMKPLPDVGSLTAANPKCYENSAQCAKSQFGCSRSLYSQICNTCNSQADGCVAAPAGYSFPDLQISQGSSSAQCTTEDNVDYSGNDIGSAMSGSADGCCSICKSNGNCHAYTWTSYNGGTCWLKSAKGSSSQSSGAKSGTVN